MLALKGDQLVAAGHRLTMTRDQFRFVIERIDLAARAGTKDHEDVLCFGREMRLTRSIRVCWIDRRTQRSLVVTEQAFTAKQLGKGNTTQTESHMIQE